MADEEFGDFEPEDAYAHDGEPEPLQLAIRLHELRSALVELAGHDKLPAWSDYDRREHEVDAADQWVELLSPDAQPEELAIAIHDERVELVDGGLDEWDELSPDARRLAIHIATEILGWLIRQGALR